ncbi:MAG: hypothetical protein Q8M31_00880 [Beijerinckiaceae bacterium]|nr:hypothetical protein [Beijerinckiaceae bacterium]
MTRSSQEAVKMFSGNEPKVLGERIENFLKNRYPAKTAQYVAADIGYSPARVAKWLEGASAPNGYAILRMLGVYGPNFIAALMGDAAPGWLDDAQRAERLKDIEARRARIDAELQALKRACARQ